MAEATATFSNGLSAEQSRAVDDIVRDIQRIRERIRGLPSHRSLASAVSRLEEAEHWVADRKTKPPYGKGDMGT